MELTRKIVANTVPPNNVEVLWLDISTLPFVLKGFTSYGKWENITVTQKDLEIVKENTAKIKDIENLIKDKGFNAELSEEQLNNIIQITVSKTLEALGVTQEAIEDDKINTPTEVYNLLKDLNTSSDFKKSTQGIVDENGILRYVLN